MTTESTIQRGHQGTGAQLVVLIVIAAVLLRGVLDSWFDGPAIQAWSTVFVSIILQATPFLALGVALSAAVAAFVPAERLTRLLPKNRVAAVATGGAAGVLLPGCECGAVPISGRLVSAGALPGAALAFMLAAPAINPVVLVSTAVAFPGRPEMVMGRLVASLITAVVMGLLVLRINADGLVRRAMSRRHVGDSKWETFAVTARHDFLQAGGFLVLGSAAAALLQVAVPRSFLVNIGESAGLGLLMMAVLAIALSICSEADAFVAASFTQVSPTAQLAFMVVGPAVDLKLASMQAGVFGSRFAVRFAPATALVAVAAAAVVGGVLL